MAKAGNDSYANYAIISVSESAANTLTFKKLETGISLSEKVAWLINRIEYILSPLNAATFNADGDALLFGLAVSSAFVTPGLVETTIIDYNSVARHDFGAAASMHWDHMPIVKDLSQLPGGGLLVPPTPLYLYGMGVGLTAATATVARLYYSLITLQVEQYWELVEARRVLTS